MGVRGHIRRFQDSLAITNGITVSGMTGCVIKFLLPFVVEIMKIRGIS